MPHPLDYRNPNADDRSGSDDRPEPGPRAAIPVEFDFLLTRSTDHAGAAAIGGALTRAGIRSFASSGRGSDYGWTEIYIRATDRERAEPIASHLFARRERLKSLPRQDVPPDIDIDLAEDD